MDNCQIPITIKVRETELDRYSKELDRMIDEFERLKKINEEQVNRKDFKQAPGDSERVSKYSRSSTKVNRISSFILQIEKLVKECDADEVTFLEIQDNSLANYKKEDFLSLKNHAIIVEIRNYKEKLVESFLKLDSFGELLIKLEEQLKLVEGTTLEMLNLQPGKLRERLTKAQDDLQKVVDCCFEMDGNTTHRAEEEFIEKFQRDTPQYDKQIDEEFDQIDEIDLLLKKVSGSPTSQEIKTIEQEITSASENIQEVQSLVRNFEKVI